MKARQRYRYRARQSDVIVDRVIWALPVPTPERQPGIKDRLHGGREGHGSVRYDNETGKGDHRHEGEQETPYHFTSLDRLIADFRDDCTRLAGWRWNESD
jgi:hypothetical protein